MSLYAEYLKERTNDQIVEDERGFATWRYLNDVQVYIVDIYVRPDFRKKGVAASFADHIVFEAKNRGCKTLIGTVVPSLRGSSSSLKVLLAYGMTPLSASNDLIFMSKEI